MPSMSTMNSYPYTTGSVTEERDIMEVDSYIIVELVARV
jgi:hypothetical protein